MSRHVMLSYQWDVQLMVKKIYNAMRSQGINTWMDIEGGVQGNINDSMAEGVDTAGVLCCFMTPEYMKSKNCKKELNYADSQDIPIVPVMCEKEFKASGWLGLITAGSLWIDFRDPSKFDTSVESLVKEVIHATDKDIQLSSSEQAAVASAHHPARKIDLKKKPGRAFRHEKAGKFLAESGEVKFHSASGSRSSLVLREKAEDTSYWVEERNHGNKEIIFYKNYHTNGYLGYDPNGDYVYTKAQNYGAEEWILRADDRCNNGKRAVVLFANYGKKYLAIQNGKLTGVGSFSDDCVWILE